MICGRPLNTTEQTRCSQVLTGLGLSKLSKDDNGNGTEDNQEEANQHSDGA